MRISGVAARAFSLAAVLSLASSSASAQMPDEGISHALAQSRAARVSDVHYDLHLALRLHADSMPGEEIVRFKLSQTKSQMDLPIDFRDGTLQEVTLNDFVVDPALHNGHIILPGVNLRSGENSLLMKFTSRISAAGAAVTRYADKEDGSEYIYSLFVPMDASMAFPCFDQPDLKARFKLAVRAHASWTVISNTAAVSKQIEDTEHGPALPQVAGVYPYTTFAETKPISTYLFAFAAGPWAKLAGMPGEPDLYVRKSQLARAQAEAPHVQEMTARGIKFLSDYFQQPFPFLKYDLVLIPGFPFGGMEHAGATFLNETGVLFRSAPTAADRFNRDTLVLHELTHQWFGDLVTMRWFDDLWLKEGFAQFMAYRALQELEPSSLPWKHLYEDIKPLAYGIDETEGTTPIFQNIPNLKDAKSAYGAIVYQKAPSILRQLQYRLGDDAFRDGLRSYLKDHAYANAQWGDLVHALEASSEQNLKPWANAWVVQRGMPQITVDYACNGPQHHISKFTIAQHDVLSDGYTWPITNEIVFYYGDKMAEEKVRVSWSTPTFEVKAAHGKLCPMYAFANFGDYAYGRFLLDAASERGVRESIMHPGDSDPLRKTMLWGALWENVHVAQSSPSIFAEFAIPNLPGNDESVTRIQFARINTVLNRYITGPVRAPLLQQAEEAAMDQMQYGLEPGDRIVGFRAFTSLAETDKARATLKQLLNGDMKVPGVELRSLDRWNMIGRLISVNDKDAAQLLAAESKRDTTDDGRKYAFAVQAGAPDAAMKQRYFNAYTTQPTAANAQQEDWLSQSIGPFNNVRQSALTLPYLQRSLDQLPEIKRDRKIFYLGVWLGGFLGGQTSPEAQTIVKQWLAQPNVDADLRRKVLENADPLERTVRIRAKFPE